MLPAKQDVISMIDQLPEQQLQKIVNYILLLRHEKPDETALTQEQEELLDLLNYNIDTGRRDFAENHDAYLYGTN